MAQVYYAPASTRLLCRLPQRWVLCAALAVFGLTAALITFSIWMTPSAALAEFCVHDDAEDMNMDPLILAGRTVVPEGGMTEPRHAARLLSSGCDPLLPCHLVTLLLALATRNCGYC